jgi:DNA polymerase
MDMLDALRLQLEWGADEAYAETPLDRRQAAPPSAPAITKAPDRKPIPGPRTAAIPAGPAEAARLAAACDTLEALQAALQNFTGCALKDTATQLVFADGNPDARIVLVGEAPGAEEDRVGRPFVGPAGQLLDKMLASIGLDRTKLRIINVVPWRPPGNRVPAESEIAVCLPFLHRQIALIRPDCLVLLGAVAAKALLPEPYRGQGIRRVRGSWLEVAVTGLDHKLPCLPTYHPAYLLRTPAEKRLAWADLLALRAHVETFRKTS